MVKFFKDGNLMGIATTCTNENNFLGEVSTGLANMIEAGVHDGDWEFQLDEWLPCVVDICCQMRGRHCADWGQKIFKSGYVPSLDVTISERKG
jgi:hypothetical protein